MGATGNGLSLSDKALLLWELLGVGQTDIEAMLALCLSARGQPMPGAVQAAEVPPTRLIAARDRHIRRVQVGP